MLLQYKFAAAIFLIGLLAVIAMGTFHYYQSRQQAIAGHLRQLEGSARQHSEHLAALLASRASTLQALAEAPVLRDSLERSNTRLGSLAPGERLARILELDDRWRAAKGAVSPFVRRRLSNPTAELLKRHLSRHPETYGEIFVTDRFGLTVAATHNLTDLYQGDEYHWQATNLDGEPRIFFDDRGYDESADAPVLGVLVPVVKKGKVLGVLKGNLLLTGALQRFVASYGTVAPGAMQIVRSGGKVILGRESRVLDGRVNHRLVTAMAGAQAGSYTHEQGDGSLVAFTPVRLTLPGWTGEFGFGGRAFSERQRSGNEGEIWYVVLRQPLKAALAPLTLRIRDAVTIGGLAMVALALVALWLGHNLTRPLARMTTALGQVGRGDLDVQLETDTRDELRKLTVTFNAMVRDLRATRASRDRLLEIIEATPDLVELARPDGTVLYRNPGGWAMLGLDPQPSLSGYRMGQILTEWSQERFHKETLPTVMQKGFWQGEMAFRHADGHEIPVVQIFLGHRGPDSQVEYLSTIAHDLTALKQHQTELERHRRLTVMGELGSVLAHQLNQPLAAAEGFIEGTLNRVSHHGDPSGLRYGLEQTLAQVQRVGEIVQGVRKFLRAGEARVQSVDLNELVGGVVPALGTGWDTQGCRIRLHLAEGLPPASMDPVLVRECLLNLVRNAVEATLETPGTERAVDVMTGMSEDGEQLEVCVRDRGKGLPGPLQENLDRPLYSTKPEGTGLGLAICRTVVEAHVGGLWATANAPEPGTTFHVTLPKGGSRPGEKASSPAATESRAPEKAAARDREGPEERTERSEAGITRRNGE